MTKKIMCLVLLLGVFFSSTSLNAEAMKPSYSENGKVKFTTLRVNDDYSRVKIDYLDTGETEYLVSVRENGEVVSYVYSKTNKLKHKIEAIGESIYVDDEYFGGELDSEDPGEFQIMSDYDQGGSTSWKYLSTTYGTSSWKYAQASIIAGVIAAVLKVPAGYSIVMSIALTFQSIEAKQTWWKRYNYVDAKATYSTCKRANKTYFYKYNNYSSLVRSTGYVVQPIDPCSSGY